MTLRSDDSSHSYGTTHIGAVVFVGRDRAGNWVVRETRGAFGGLFIDRAEAMKYALFKNRGDPENIIEVASEIEFEIPKP